MPCPSGIATSTTIRKVTYVGSADSRTKFIGKTCKQEFSMNSYVLVELSAIICKGDNYSYNLSYFTQLLYLLVEEL